VNFNYNIPPKQRRIQQLVAQFNADEELWLILESKRVVVASSIPGCLSNLKDSLICWSLPEHGRRKTVSVFRRQTLTQNRSLSCGKNSPVSPASQFHILTF
jgi:hypothetical protein